MIQLGGPTAEQKRALQARNRVAAWLDEAVRRLKTPVSGEDSASVEESGGDDVCWTSREIACRKPGCPPLEVVITLWRSVPNGGPLMQKILKPATEVREQRMNALDEPGSLRPAD